MPKETREELKQRLRNRIRADQACRLSRDGREAKIDKLRDNILKNNKATKQDKRAARKIIDKIHDHTEQEFINEENNAGEDTSGD